MAPSSSTPVDLRLAQIINLRMKVLADLWGCLRTPAAVYLEVTHTLFLELTMEIADELLKLKQLLDQGVLTEDEFAAQKAKLLGQGSPPSAAAAAPPAPVAAAPAVPAPPARADLSDVTLRTKQISNDHLGRFLAMVPVESRPLLACRLKQDYSFLVIVIPLWFNMLWIYLVVTEEYLGLAERTLWNGCKEMVYFDNDLVESVTLVEEKKMLSNTFKIVIEIEGQEEPVEFGPVDKASHQYLVESLPLLEKVYGRAEAIGPI